METKTVVGAILATALFAENVIKHEQGYPHTHVDVAPPIYKTRTAVNVYNISINASTGQVFIEGNKRREGVQEGPCLSGGIFWKCSPIS